jgi:hypothetical protein
MFAYNRQKFVKFKGKMPTIFKYSWSFVLTGKFFEFQYINYKASIIGILIMLALNNINYKASIIGILIMLALKYKAALVFLPIN